MKLTAGIFVCFLGGCWIARAQVLPSSSGGCSVSASVVSCNWLSVFPKPQAHGTTSKESASPAVHDFYVTRLNLSPGAPLPKLVCGEDRVIVGMGKGELVNTAKTPPLHIPVSDGSVFLMPKEEQGELRNVGERELDVLDICLHPVYSAGQ